MTHTVAVFISHEAKTFAITARDEYDTNWRLLNTIKNLPGVQRINLLEKTTPEFAEAFKNKVYDLYTTSGYTQLTLRRFIDDATAFEE